MKRIIFSVLAIAMAIGLTTGAAFALFSSTATVSGVTFSTGNAALKVYDNAGGWTSSYNPGNFLFQNMFPGYTNSVKFTLYNNSSSNISMKLNAKIADGVTENPAGSWDILKDVVLVRFLDSSSSPLTGWASLNYWNTTGAQFDTGLAQNTTRDYYVDVMIDSSVGNTISGKELTAMKFDFLGTQE